MVFWEEGDRVGGDILMGGTGAWHVSQPGLLNFEQG